MENGKNEMLKIILNIHRPIIPFLFQRLLMGVGAYTF